jgi:hypothetical protein
MLLAQRLIVLENDGWEALVAGNGRAYDREHLDANAVMAFPFRRARSGCRARGIGLGARVGELPDDHPAAVTELDNARVPRISTSSHRHPDS